MEQLKQDTEVKKIGYLDLLSESDFIKLALAKIISRFGDSIDIVAYGWLVFQLTGSAALLAVLYAVSGIPSFLFNLISGVVVTYLPKKKVVFISDIGRGLTVLVTALLYMTGNLVVWHLFLFAFINSTFEAFRDPAATPLFLQSIKKEKLEYGVATLSSVSTVAEIVGFSVAGILIATIGLGYVIMIDAATFICSGLLIAMIKVKEESLTKVKLSFKQYFFDLKEGFSYVSDSKVILSVCLFAGMFNLLVIPFNALQPAYVSEILEKGPEAISVMSIAFLIAMLLGGLISPLLKEKVSGKFMFIMGGTLIASGYLLLPLLGYYKESPYIFVFLATCSALMGIAIPLINLPIQIAIMTKVDQTYLPRTVSFVNALALSTTPLGGALVGILIISISLKAVFMMFSIAIFILFALQLFNKALKAI